MTIQEAIKKAIEEGWNYNGSDMNEYTGYEHNIKPQLAFLDPQFWVCLGKAMGWKKEISCPDHRPCCIVMHYEMIWKPYWHDFIDALAEGKSAESFFKELK